MLLVTQEKRWVVGEDKLGVLENAYTLLYVKWITNKDLLDSPGKSTQDLVSAYNEREWGKKWNHFTVHLKFVQYYKSTICQPKF